MRKKKFQLVWQNVIYEPLTLEEIVSAYWEVNGVQYMSTDDTTKGQMVSTTAKDYRFFSEDEDDYGVWREYTGLKDKNGVEIYEGDYITIKRKGEFKLWLDNEIEKPNEVKWDGCCYSVTDHERTLYHCCEGTNKEGYEVEVVGNIYQHPELLTK